MLYIFYPLFLFLSIKMGTISPFSVDCSGTSTYFGAVSPHNSCHTSAPTTSGSYGEIPTITITTPPANRAFEYNDTSKHPLSQFSNNANYRPPFKLPSLPQSVTSARNLPGVCDSPSLARHASEHPVPLRSTVLSDSKTSTDTSNTTSSSSKHGSTKHTYSANNGKLAVKRSLTQPILETEMTNFKPDYTSESTDVNKVPRLQHNPLKRSRSNGSVKFKKFKQRVQALTRRNSAFQLEQGSDCSDSDPNFKSYKNNQDGEAQVKRKKSLRKSVFKRVMSPIQASPLLQGNSDSDSSQLFNNATTKGADSPPPNSHTVVHPVPSARLQRVQTLSDSDQCNSSISSVGAASSRPVVKERKYPPYVFKSNSYKGYMKEKKPPSKVTLAWMDLSTDDNSSTSQMGHPGK